MHKNMCSKTIVIVSSWKKTSPKHINTTWHIHTMEYITAETKKALKLHATTWINGKVSGRSLAQNDMNSVIPFILNSKSDKTKSQYVGCTQKY